MNLKVVGTLVSMAFIAIIVYMTAVFHVEPLKAGTATSITAVTL